jgi:GNAT superfamily N-acetyltransferase
VTTFRPVTARDVDACLNVFYVSLDELHERVGQPAIPRNPHALELVFGHLMATDPQRCWVAEDDGKVIGFGLAHQRGDHWYLGFLFILPGSQGRGVGRALLERCLPPPMERPTTRLSVAVEAVQPVSTALYAQYGMVPRVPLYVMLGDVKPGVLPDAGAGLVAAGLEALAFASLEDSSTVAAAVDRLDAEVVGYARRQEHAFLAVPDRIGFLYRHGEKFAAYGYVQPSGRIGPVASLEPAWLPAIIGHLVAAVRPLGAWQAIVPGPAKDALLPLLQAGFRFDDAPAIYCASWDGPRFDRYLPINFALD